VRTVSWPGALIGAKQQLGEMAAQVGVGETVDATVSAACRTSTNMPLELLGCQFGAVSHELGGLLGGTAIFVRRRAAGR
jgi:hypothetical protein